MHTKNRNIYDVDRRNGKQPQPVLQQTLIYMVSHFALIL